MRRAPALGLLALLSLAGAWWLLPRAEPLGAPELAGEAASQRSAEGRSTPSASSPALAATSRQAVAVEAVVAPDPGPDGIAGIAVNQDGAPVPAAQITVRAEGMSSDAPALAAAACDPQGRFGCTGLERSRRHVVRAEAPGYLVEEQLATTGDRIRVTLLAGASVRGVVTDAAHRPVVGARMSLQIEGDGERVGPSGLATRVGTATAVTDAYGAYRLAPVPSRFGMRLCIHPPDGGPESRRLDILYFREHTVDVELGATEPFHGCVRDLATGVPIAEALVREQELAEPIARSDADGRFMVRLPLEQTALLRIAASGYAPVVHTVPCRRAERQQEFTILLPRGGRVTGRVLDGAGAPVVGAQLTLERLRLTDARAADRERAARPALPRPGGDATRFGELRDAAAQSGPDGRFEIQGVIGPDGVFHGRVRARHGGFCDGWSEPFDLDPPVAEAQTRVTLFRGGVIEGTLLRNERPAPGSVTVGALRVQTDGGGGFVLGPVPPGVVDVTADVGAISHIVRTLRVPVPEGGRTRIQIEVCGGQETLAGRVRDAAGAPQDGARIECTDPATGAVAALTWSGADGRWSASVPCDRDQPTRYTVTACSGLQWGQQLQVLPPRGDVDFTLPALGGLPLRVKLPNGEPPSWIHVYFQTRDGGPLRAYTTRPLDAYEYLDNSRLMPEDLPADTVLQLPLGDVDLRIEGPSCGRLVLPAVRVPDQQPLEVVLRHGARLTLDFAGEVAALEHRALLLVRADDPVPDPGQIDLAIAHGACIHRLALNGAHAELLRLARGRYRLLSEDRDLAFDPEWIEVEDRDVRHRVRLRVNR